MTKLIALSRKAEESIGKFIPRYTPFNWGITGYNNLAKGHYDSFLFFCQLCKPCCATPGVGDVGHNKVRLLEHPLVAP